MNQVIQGFLVLIGVYALAGAAFGLWFIALGAPRCDPMAARAPLRVRLLFLPGAVAVWPLLLSKTRRFPARRGPADQSEPR